MDDDLQRLVYLADESILGSDYPLELLDRSHLIFLRNCDG
jgi:hypothetical protein